MTDGYGFQGHASQDSGSRFSKARKIEAILGRRCRLPGVRLIDIGAGSGIIAQYFANLGADVVATDRDAVDAQEEISVHRTRDSRLPFQSGSFDVAIYNHVIEHVGEKADQLEHLREIRRILRPSGLLYIAVPNRWAIIEPHYRVPLLSWISVRTASRIVRLTGKGRWYDCRPLTRRELDQMLRATGFSVEDVTYEALEHFIGYELSPTMRRFAALIPHTLMRAFMLIIPTNIFIARA